MAIYAAVDVGLNQVLLFIAKVENGSSDEVLFDKGEITRLGADLPKMGLLKKEAMERTLVAIKTFKQYMTDYNVENYYAVGTAALREAKNSEDFLKMVKMEAGIEIDVIPGEEEARLSFIAVVKGLDLGDRETVIADIGGGSTEFIYGKQSKILDRFSLKIGTLRMTENFLQSDPVKDEEFNLLMKYLGKEFESLNLPFNNTFLVGIGGTMTNLGAIKHKLEKYDPKIIHGSTITLEELNSIISDLTGRTIDERKKSKDFN